MKFMGAKMEPSDSLLKLINGTGQSEPKPESSHKGGYTSDALLQMIAPSATAIGATTALEAEIWRMDAADSAAENSSYQSRRDAADRQRAAKDSNPMTQRRTARSLPGMNVSQSDAPQIAGRSTEQQRQDLKSRRQTRPLPKQI
jgi:hypothetical protein